MTTDRRPASVRGRVLLAAALLATLAAPMPLRADDASRPELCRAGDRPAAVFDLRPLFGEELDRLLKNGMEHTVVAQVALRDASIKNKVLATGVRTFVVRYFLWEDFYKVDISDGIQRTVKRVRDLPTLRGLLAQRTALPLFGREALPPGHEVVLALTLDLDPMDREQLKNLRRRLANPRARDPSSSPGGSSLFGTMSGLFIDQSKFRSKRSLKIKGGASVKLGEIRACPIKPTAP